MQKQGPANPLDVIEAFLDGKGGDIKPVRKALKELRFKEAMGEDPAADPLVRLLSKVLVGCVKPVLTGHLERQSLVDRLVRRLEQGEGRDEEDLKGDEGLLAAVTEVSGWIREVLSVRVQQKKEGEDRNEDILARLLANLKLLTSGQDTLVREAEQLLAGDLDASDSRFVERINHFCTVVEERGRPLLQSFERERELFRTLVADLARSMREMKESSGDFGGRLDEAVFRLEESLGITELNHIRSLLLEETRALRDQTATLHQRLMESEMRLLDSEERLREMEEALAKSKSESMTDHLTGVANRRAFNHRLDEEVARARRHGGHLSLIMFDLDFFKRINDTYGHPVGDKVLINICRKAKSLIRESDFIGRYGGEEFALILPETELVAAVQVAEKIRHEVVRLRFRMGEEYIKVTCSFGVCQFKAGQMNRDSFLQLADDALYQAKHNGRNRVEIARSAP